MKIVFFGSDDFALVILEKLMTSAHSTVACVTQPDRRKGRNLEISFLPTKGFAVSHNIPLLQPTDLHDKGFLSQLKTYEADIFVIVAYGKILPAEILSLPKIFCVNIHGSLLPKYRGAAPINWAIINGDSSTGMTIIKMNPVMDAGDIILTKTVKIEEADNAVTLRAKMAKVGADLLLETLGLIEKKAYALKTQNEAAVTLAPKLTKEHGEINWQKSATEIHNLTRGLLPWPTAYTYYNGKLLKILETAPKETAVGKFLPGQVMEILKEGLVVATGQGALLIRRLHLDSSKPMDAQNFVAGHKIGVGFKFG